jgi:chromosome partitioning protein
MIIGVLNQKGGVGKTTIATNLAAQAASDGACVLLVDADPQGSSMAWSAARTADPLFPTVAMAKTTLHRDMPEVARGYDTVLIDGAPRVSELARSVIMASDMVLIPVGPSPYDLWAAGDIVALINEARIYRPDLKAQFVVNRRIVGTALGRNVVGALAEFELPVCAAYLSQRVAYAESAAQGLAVFELEPLGAAAREVERLAAELLTAKELAAGSGPQKPYVPSPKPYVPAPMLPKVQLLPPRANIEL